MTSVRWMSLGIWLVSGCARVSQDDLEWRLDPDGDGSPLGEDCDDGDPTVYPGAPESWYDGVDQDCGGDDDFDADGDGWVPQGYAGRSTSGVPGSGALPGGDCWDTPDRTPSDQVVVPASVDVGVGGEPYVSLTADQVNPGVAVDTWYDGQDANCDGADDFDQDGDGYRSMFHADATGAVGDDCIDGSWRDWDNPALVPAEQVNPSAIEVWYDGTDEDCDEQTDDCDAHGDGYWLDGLDAGMCRDESQDCDGVDDDCAVGLGDTSAGGVCEVGDMGLADANLKLTRDAGTGRVGAQLTMTGDFDGDGVSDMVISVPYADTAFSNAGAVYVGTPTETPTPICSSAPASRAW